MRNRRGSSTDPCGTRDTTGSVKDWVPLTTTHIVVGKIGNFGSILQCEGLRLILGVKRACGTESKALLISKKTGHISFLLLRDCKQSWEKDSKAAVVDVPREKPHCPSEIG